MSSGMHHGGRQLGIPAHVAGRTFSVLVGAILAVITAAVFGVPAVLFYGVLFIAGLWCTWLRRARRPVRALALLIAALLLALCANIWLNDQPELATLAAMGAAAAAFGGIWLAVPNPFARRPHVCTRGDPWTPAKGKYAIHPEADRTTSITGAGTLRCPHCGVRAFAPDLLERPDLDLIEANIEHRLFPGGPVHFAAKAVYHV